MRPLSVLTFLLILPALGLAQTTLYVDVNDTTTPWLGTQQDPFQKIQDGIDAALDGDTVLVLPGIYLENITFSDQAITVKSEKGATVTVIDGNNLRSVVEFIDSGSVPQVLDGFNLKNGKGFPRYVYPGYKYYGGGVYCWNSSPTITNNIIEQCTATYGGGIYCDTNSNVTITNNIIYGNTAVYLGGGTSVHYSSALIVNNIVYENSANQGGGLYLVHAQTPYVITNNTIAMNTAADEGGGIRCDAQASCDIANTILWDNTNGFTLGHELSIYNLVTVNIDNCDVKGGQTNVEIDASSTLNWGAAMLDTNPLFEDSDSGDFHLQTVSPCMNAGDNDAAGILPFDFEGDDRIVDGTVDMGADEVASVDSDNDGLTDAEEAILGTDPNDPDSDDDGLTDGAEVEMDNGSGLPDPLNPDSDGDSLLDGYEVDQGTDPANHDSDGDGLWDNVDPIPTEPGATTGFMETMARDTADDILELDLGLFKGNYTFIKQVRRASMAYRCDWAAIFIAYDNIPLAIFFLETVRWRLDGDDWPPDWMPDSAEKAELLDQVTLMIDLLYLL